MINIKADRLEHFYGDFQALIDVTFEIQQGTIVGLVGPNGAGKTTTMKILTGCLVPTSGAAAIAGHDIVTDRLAAQRQLGYLPESAPLYRDMAVQDYLLYMAKLRGVEADRRLHRLAAVVRACNLESVMTKPIGHLSKGFRQRTGLAQAMIHDPAILILDEPTSGLDPNQILEIRELIRALGVEKTVVLSTHILSEVEAMCSRAIVIVGGKVHADEQLAQFGVISSARVKLGSAAPDARTKLAAIPGVTSVDVLPDEDGRPVYQVTADGKITLLDAIGTLAASSRWTVVELSAARRDLEDIFRGLEREKEPVS